MFRPTLGLLRMTGISRAFKSLTSPIPELRRICGEPIDPADRITSLEAVKTVMADGSSRGHNSTVRIVFLEDGSPDFSGKTRVTMVLRTMSRFFRDWM